jgi:hypothetical protein
VVFVNEFSPTEKEGSRRGELTHVERAFAVQSAGFPVENLLEPDAGAVGRTAAANPFEAYFGVADRSRLYMFTVLATYNVRLHRQYLNVVSQENHFAFRKKPAAGVTRCDQGVMLLMASVRPSSPESTTAN